MKQRWLTILVLSAFSSNAFAGQTDQALGLTGLIVGGLLSASGAFQIMSIHGTTNENLYDDECRGDTQCEDEHWQQDLKSGQRSFWVGASLMATGFTILKLEPFDNKPDQKLSLHILPNRLSVRLDI